MSKTVPPLYCVKCPYTVGFFFRGHGQRWPQHCGEPMVREEERKVHIFGICTPTPEDNQDYCTILRTATGWRYLAAVMRYDRTSDQWVIRQSWGPMAKIEAEAMAREWAKTGKLEYRP